ncbi:MAG: hypothetical protein MZV63_33985 [Marinilabiliales bacterium]|nr:hypothetical protein [Marinilabiliales bacterium]
MLKPVVHYNQFGFGFLSEYLLYSIVPVTVYGNGYVAEFPGYLERFITCFRYRIGSCNQPESSALPSIPATTHRNAEVLLQCSVGYSVWLVPGSPNSKVTDTNNRDIIFRRRQCIFLSYSQFLITITRPYTSVSG